MAISGRHLRLVQAIADRTHLVGGGVLDAPPRNGTIFAGDFPVIRPGTAKLHPKGTSSRFALRAPRPRWGLAMTNLWALRHRMCAAIIANLQGAHRPQRARCIRFLQKSSKNHDFHLADFAFVWYIFILWTKNLLGNTAQLQLRPSPDIFRRSIGLKSLRYTKYICTFQTLSRQKISRRMLLLNHALLP